MKAKESLCTILVGSMKVLGSLISVKAGAMNYLAMETLTKASICKEKPMAKEPTLGSMEKCTMASGSKARSADTAYGKAFMATAISASGKIARLKAMECMFGSMETGMRASGISASGMEMVLTFLPTETLTMASTTTVNLKATDSTSGPMATLTLVSLTLE